MRKLEFIIIFQVLLAFNLVYDAESQLVNITSQPPSPVSVLEGQPLTLKWSFSVAKTFLRLQLALSGSFLAFLEASPGSPSVIRGVFRGRVSASSTETNATITFSSVKRTDTARYVFSVINTDGDFSSAPLQLFVQYPPTLITRAPDQVVLEGDSAISLTCTADGEPAPNITWTKVFANGSDSDILFTGGQFNLPNNGTNYGTYRCKASNGIGNDVNHTVNVVVNFKPETVQLMASKTTLCKGESIYFNCSANSKPAFHSYQLYENGTMVSEGYSGGGVWLRTMATRGVFVNKCKVTNSIGTAMSENVFITVNEPATIERVEKSTVAEGGYLTLSCQVSGDPFPSVSWVKVMGGKRFNGSNLSLRNVNGDASGEYTCEAANLCSSVSRVTVVGGPKITYISAPHILSRPEMLTLNCTADGEPTPNITWTRLSNGETVNMPLTVTGKNYEEGYRCTASNELGTVLKDTSVTRGYCEEVCEGGRTCRVGLCGCPIGKTGDTCEKMDERKKTVVVGLVLTMRFIPVYSDLENTETKALILKIERAVKAELSGTELTQVRVASLKEGSVIADVELTFNSSTYEDYLRGRLQDATKDNKLGDLDVEQVVVGRFISTGKLHCLKSPRYLVAKEIIEDVICASGSVCNLVN